MTFHDTCQSCQQQDIQLLLLPDYLTDGDASIATGYSVSSRASTLTSTHWCKRTTWNRMTPQGATSWTQCLIGWSPSNDHTMVHIPMSWTFTVPNVEFSLYTVICLYGMESHLWALKWTVLLVPSRGMGRLLRLCGVNRDGQEEVGFGTLLPPQNLEWTPLKPEMFVNSYGHQSRAPMSSMFLNSNSYWHKVSWSHKDLSDSWP